MSGCDSLCNKRRQFNTVREAASMSSIVGSARFGDAASFGHGGHGHGGHGRRRFGRGGYWPGTWPGYVPGQVCIIDPKTQALSCVSFGSPGGFVLAPVGSGGLTSSFSAYGVLDPTELLAAQASASTGTDDSASLANTITALSPAITTVVDALNDPIKRVAVLKAKIADAKRKGKSRATIEKLQAKLYAAQERMGVKQESLDSTRDWRNLGKVGLITGIGIGAAVIFFILSKSFK